MELRRPPHLALVPAAAAASLIAVLHVYALAWGSIADAPNLAGLLVLAVILGAILMVLAVFQKRFLAWPALALVWVPFLGTFPAPLASPAGLAYVTLLLVATAAVLGGEAVAWLRAREAPQ